jgi:hypothetical protein
LPNEGYFGDKPQSLEIANTSENEPSCSPKIFSHSSSIETMSSVTDSGFIDVYCKSSVSPEDCNDKGVMSLVQRRIADAVTHFSEAIALQYNFPMAHFNLGIAFKEFNSLEKAVSSFQRAIGLNPVFIEAHVSLGMALLLSGNFPSGWSEYEWRLKLKKVSYKAPPWDGQFRRGATLLVYCEQGIGDTIQFARYMPLIRQHEMQVVLLCPQVLHRLLTCISGPSAIVVDHEALPDYDYYCSLLSLPYLLRTDLSNLPSFTPYFHLPHNGLHLWANRLRELDQPIKIGLCWQGNPHHLDDRLRSLKLRQLECLASIPGISWVSLQNRPLLIEEKETAERLHLIDVHEHLDDFSESAALIHELDLVISVDTAVAHLAGALNRPAWTLIRFAPDWRWLLDRNDTPWYPSMLLFRQDSPDNWDTVIDKIRVTLGNIMASTLSRKVV